MRSLTPCRALLVAALLLAFAAAAAGGGEGAPPAARADAIVLLAGSYEERAATAAKLWGRGLSPRVLLTDDRVRRGWSQKHGRNLYAIERTEELLVRQGVPGSALVRLPFSRSGTVYDALMVRRYLLDHGLRSVLLVTSDYHLQRACWIFGRALDGTGISVAGCPAPSSAGFLRLLGERVKFCYYLLRYGLFPLPAVPVN